MSPAALFSGLLAWLPDKHEALICVLDKEHAQDTKEFLSSRHWTNVSYVHYSQELWSGLEQQGLLETEGDPSLRKRLLFKPCTLLQQEIDRIERSLLQPDAESSCSENGCQTGQRRFRALEPGCGSARNLVWLLGRESASWEVLGIDSGYGILVRVQELLQHTGVKPSQAQLRYNSISQSDGKLETLPMRESHRASAAQADQTHISCDDASQLAPCSWDLILCIRFLERAFLNRIPALLRPGGFLLYCSFLDTEGTRTFGRPTGSKHLLQPGELLQLFGSDQGFEILRDDTTIINDGREVSMYVARKL